MTPDLQAIQSELASIVGAEHVRDGRPADLTAECVPRLVVEPGSVEQVAQVLRAAREAHLRVIPRGGGTKLAWGNPPQGAELMLATHRLAQVLEHAWGDMTATVEAGCSVSRLQDALAQHGQRLALDPLWPDRATVGGILATNDSGALRVRYGALRDLIIGITVVLSDGTIARSGGKVVKNVAGYDLPKLFTGSLGSLGIIVEATFRLYPLPQQTRSYSFALASAAEANRLVLAILDSSLVPTGLQLRADEGSAHVDVRFEGVPAAIEAQARQLGELSAGARPVEAPRAWDLRQALWQDAEAALICKFSTLPAQIGATCRLVARVAERLQLRGRLVAQATGIGLLRLDGRQEQALLAAFGVLRDELEAQEGSLVLLHGPAELRGRIDAWGRPGDALPLMRRVKQHFDPTGILNPGRFVGGI